MNFFEPTISLEIWTGKVAFIIVTIVMLIVPISMFLWMQRRGWM